MFWKVVNLVGHIYNDLENHNIVKNIFKLTVIRKYKFKKNIFKQIFPEEKRTLLN